MPRNIRSIRNTHNNTIYSTGFCRFVGHSSTNWIVVGEFLLKLITLDLNFYSFIHSFILSTYSYDIAWYCFLFRHVIVARCVIGSVFVLAYNVYGPSWILSGFVLTINSFPLIFLYWFERLYRATISSPRQSLFENKLFHRGQGWYGGSNATCAISWNYCFFYIWFSKPKLRLRAIHYWFYLFPVFSV